MKLYIVILSIVLIFYGCDNNQQKIKPIKIRVWEVEFSRTSTDILNELGFSKYLLGELNYQYYLIQYIDTIRTKEINIDNPHSMTPKNYLENLNNIDQFLFNKLDTVLDTNAIFTFNYFNVKIIEKYVSDFENKKIVLFKILLRNRLMEINPDLDTYLIYTKEFGTIYRKTIIPWGYFKLKNIYHINEFQKDSINLDNLVETALNKFGFYIKN